MSSLNKKPVRKIISALVLICLIFNLVWFCLVWPKKSYAQLAVTDPAHTAATAGGWINETGRWVQDNAKEIVKQAKISAGALAFRTALIYLLRTLATDVATWMASGGKGQQPMFITKGWGAYLLDIADGTAGKFIETYASGGQALSQAGVCDDNCNSVYVNCGQKCQEELNTAHTEGYTSVNANCEEECGTSFTTCRSKCGSSLINQTVYGGTTSGTGIIPFLCDPSSLAVKAKITMGLAEIQRPRKPTCTVRSMLQNWDQTINDPNFLQRFQYYFDPYQSDLGIALTLQTNLLEEKARKQLEEQLKLTANKGVKDVTNPASQILTPAWMVEKMGAKPIEESIKSETTPTGDILADAIATFASTLIGQLFQRWIKEGMAKLYGGESGGDDGDYTALYDFDVAYPYAGIQAAKARFMKIFQPTFTPGGKYEVLQKLTSCSDYNNPGPDECVITEKFRSAIENQMTVKEAIEQGYLDGGLTFGFNAQGYEPSYNQGYPYRSLIILRKYRIIPVGWELAAYYIGNFQGAQPSSYSLNDVIAGYNVQSSPFYKLIDPTWVLKAPEGYCRKEAPGEKITSLNVAQGTDTNNDGKYDGENESPPRLTLTRADYCADDQTCIMENPDGTCKYYGYCMEEKRAWKFSGTGCESKWASCQTFQSRQGETFSYLKNTLNFNGCNQENYGCSWYCQDYSPSVKYWACQDAVNSYQRCGLAGGCSVKDPITQKRCIIPYQGVTCTIPTCQSQGNLIQNGDFEQGSKYVLNNWTTSFYSPLTSEGFSKDGTQKHDGANSLMFYAVNLAGNYTAANNVLVKSSTTYDVSGWIYNNLNQGVVKVSVKDVLGNILSSCSNEPANGSKVWQQFNCNSIKSGGLTNLILVLETEDASGVLSGSVWFDQIEVKEQCSTEPIKLFLNNGTGVFSPTNSIFFDHDAETCSQSAEGCSEFLRIQPNSGANLLPNGNFEEFSGNVDDLTADNVYNWQGQGEIISDKYAGNYALKVPAAGSIRGAAFAGTYIYGRHFVLSLYAKNCTASDNYQILGGPSGVSASKPFDGSTEWKRYALDYLFPLTGYCSGSPQACFFNSDCPAGEICEQLGKFVRAQITADAASANCTIDNVQLEEGNSVTSYKDYGTVDKAYLKKAPDYYDCYDTDTINDFAECQNYTLGCSEEEVGCQKYTPTNGDPAVPGVVKSDDYCPAECIGYDTYKQRGTFFGAEPAALDYFIPKKQKTCSAQAAGCAEFTNLDEVARGGEGREYYTYLRQCQKPDVAACTTFYTWVGSEQSGYQLKSYGLRNIDANPNEPDTIPTSLDLGPCANINDALTNPECKEFYNSTTGVVSYVHYRATVVCSDDCHPLRISQSTPIDCTFSGGTWDGSNCLYTAIPKESYRCSASDNGCREYKGNTSYNKMTVVKDTFESGVNNWTNGTLSGESLTVGGHSLNVSGADISYNLNAQCSLGVACADPNGCLCQVNGQDVCLVANGQSDCIYKQLLNKDRTYLLSFWAKGQGDLIIKFASADCALGQCFANGTITLTPDWHLYNLGPVYATWDPAFPDNLNFLNFEDNSFIDNIILTEVRDDIFVIKTTPWNVPTICDQDQFGGSSPQFMLGCKIYRSSQNKVVNLKSFANLCGEDKVGCEALIDTYNSSSPFEQVFNTKDKGEVALPADASVYLVNNPQKSCRAADKGCQMFGLPELDQKEKAADWDSIYLKNNPDEYNQILCKYSELGCEKWQTAKGDYYFKDPKNLTCEYKIKEGEKDYDWSKIDGEECKTNDDSDLDPAVVANELGKIIPVGECLNSANDGQACLKDEDCQSNSFPYAFCSRWAGSCPSDQSSCTEFIDPASSFAKNLLFNGNFSQDVNIPKDGADGWSTDNNATGAQEVNLEANTLYTISALSNGSQNLPDLQIKIRNCPGLFSPDNSLNLAVTPPRLAPLGASSPFEGSYSARFYTTSAIKCVIELPADFKTYLQEVNLRETGLYYNLAETVDQTSCNGLVNFEEGCVLFNKRDVASSSGYANLVYDADKSLANNPPLTDCGNTDPGLCDTNVLLKVRPDRVCDKWLYCRSSIETRTPKGEIEKNCLDVSLCDGVNERGECNSFPQFNLPGGNDNLTYNKSTAEQLQDLAGYVKVGYNWGKKCSNSAAVCNIDADCPVGGVCLNRILAGDRLFSKMPQIGGESYIANGNFEESAADGTPFGWKNEGTNSSCSQLSVIDNPVDMQKEGLGQRAIEGAKVLRLSTGCNATTEYISIIPNSPNIISLWFNTINLSEGEARVIIRNYNNAGTAIGVPVILKSSYGLNWTHLSSSFNFSGPRVKIVIESTSTSSGSRFYADDVRISPVLDYQDPDQYQMSSCRGYADNAALSCDYKEESGLKKIGWWGYCLENDRKPANPDQCLIWWPVDLIRSKGIEEGLGYDDKFPVYYSTGWTNGNIVTFNSGFSPTPIPFSGSSTNYTLAQMNAANCKVVQGYYVCFHRDSIIEIRTWASGNLNASNGWAAQGCLHHTAYCDEHQCRATAIFDANDFLERINFARVSPCDHQPDHPCDWGQITFVLKTWYADRIVQVVTPTGQNKYWAGRVYKGSDYRTPCNPGIPYYNQECTYLTDDSPFGSVAPPFPADDPYQWDSESSDTGYQPLYYKVNTNEARPGQFHTVNNVKRLFAQSYGVWEWNAQACIGGANDGKACATDSDCAGTCSRHCYFNPGAGVIYGGSCSAAADCLDEVDNYGQAKCDVTFRCDSGCRTGLACANNNSCRNGDCNASNVCDSGVNMGAACATDAQCQMPNCFQCDATNRLCLEDTSINCTANTGLCTGSCSGGGSNRYIKVEGQDWTQPAENCQGPGGARPVYDPITRLCNGGNCYACSPMTPTCDYCAVLPRVENIKIDTVSNGDVYLKNNGFINLTFNSVIDSQQLPMVAYSVLWGDGDANSVSGISMQAKPSPDNPHSLHHLYGYWDLKAKDLSSGEIECAASGGAVFTTICPVNSACCAIQPKIRIKDNWDWCNHGTTINECDQPFNWDAYNGYIIVTEKND